MLIQDQLPHQRVTDENLAFYRAIGVDYLAIYPPPALSEYADMVDYFKQARRQAERHGLRLYNAAIVGPDEITLGQAGRDSKIEEYCNWIRALGTAGVPTLGYNFKPVGNFRTPAATGRGGAQYSTFVWDEYTAEGKDFPDKHIGAEELFENLRYFHQRIIPVAEEANVTLALHPDDPPIPEVMGGAARIVSSLDQYERIFSATPSPSNAMLFCQGCVREMGEDVPQAIRRMRDKISYVHFRNIRGTPRSFREVFIDEGDVDMFAAMQAYRDVGFEGPFMMDHTPHIPGDRDQREGHAYAVGFIRALIGAVYR